jgi:hypothetical protein
VSACTCPCPTCGAPDLTTLRADVERLRDEAEESRKDAERTLHMVWNQGGVPAYQMRERSQYESSKWTHQSAAFEIVLDLIDKRAREGQ